MDGASNFDRENDAAGGAGKFVDPHWTNGGEPRAAVAFDGLETLWINTGTLCNIACGHCYIESSPTNDALEYISLQEASALIDEAKSAGAREIAYTGGEPFMNPDFPAILRYGLSEDLPALVLTNAMQPMMRPRVQDALLALNRDYGDRLRIRVSLDHYSAIVHDRERGVGAFARAMRGLEWLANNGFSISVAGRALADDDEQAIRNGYCGLFNKRSLPLDSTCPEALVIFPEMDDQGDPPEITDRCWGILGVRPGDMMCANSRMAVKRRGAAAPTVVACTLLPYAEEFDLGPTIKDAAVSVRLNHRHCATFCVLGGASCSGG